MLKRRTAEVIGVERFFQVCCVGLGELTLEGISCVKGRLVDLRIGYDALNGVCSALFSPFPNFLPSRTISPDTSDSCGFSQDCHKTQPIVCSALHASAVRNKVRVPILVKTRIDCILDKAGLALGNLPKSIFPTSPPVFYLFHYNFVN